MEVKKPFEFHALSSWHALYDETRLLHPKIAAKYCHFAFIGLQLANGIASKRKTKNLSGYLANSSHRKANPAVDVSKEGRITSVPANACPWICQEHAR